VGRPDSVRNADGHFRQPCCREIFIIADIVARVTTGRPWPHDSANDDGAGDVVLVYVEDVVSVVQRPRPVAAEASVDHFLRFLKREKLSDAIINR